MQETYVCQVNERKNHWLKTASLGVPTVAQWFTNTASIHEDTGSIPSLAQWVKDPTLP